MSATETQPQEAPQTQTTGSDAVNPTLMGDTVLETEQPDASGEQQQATEATAEEPKEAEDEGAPEAYEFTAPEGTTFDPNSDTAKALADVARSLNLSNAKAQSLIDGVVPAMQKQARAQFDTLRSQWRDAVKADSEIGGEKLPATLSAAKAAMERFGSPELKELLTNPANGLGDNPELIRLLARVHAATSDDQLVTGAAGAAPRVRQPLYPNSNMVV